MKSTAESASKKEHKVFYGFVLLFLIAGGGHYLWKNWDRLLVWPQKREALLQSLRDPSSAQFREERLRRTGYLCGQVNAKNGMGGYTGFRRYASNERDHVVEDSLTGPQFEVQWEQRCG